MCFLYAFLLPASTVLYWAQTNELQKTNGLHYVQLLVGEICLICWQSFHLFLPGNWIMGSNLLAIGSSVCRSLDEEENRIHACTPIPQKQTISCLFSCKILLEGIPPSRRNRTTVFMCQTINELGEKT